MNLQTPPLHACLSLSISSWRWIKNRIFEGHAQSRSRTLHCSATSLESCQSVSLTSITHVADRPSPVCLLMWGSHTLHSTPCNRRHTGKTCWFQAPDVIQCWQGVLPGPLCHQKNHLFASLFLLQKVTVFQARCCKVSLGFPVSISKCWDGSQHSKLPLHASHVALPT